MINSKKLSERFGYTAEKSDGLRKDMRNALFYFLGSVLVYMLTQGLITPVSDATMRILNIRQENVSVYVKSPWSEVLQRHLSVSSGCKVPQRYSLFEHVNLSLSHLGDSVNVEIPDQKKTTSINIPGDSVIVDPVHVRTDGPEMGCVSETKNKTQQKMP